MNRKIISILMTILLSGSLYAKDDNGKKAYATTRQVMNEVFQSFVNLIPYATSEMKFRDPKSEQYIIGNLNKISRAFKNAKHLRTFKSPNFAPSYEVVTDHLEQTIDSFNAKNKIFARTRLKATTQICMSCHTQLGSKKLSSTFRAINVVNRGDFQSDYEYAEYLYLVRDYNKAIRYYEKEIQNRISKNKSLKKVHFTDTSYYADFTVEKSLQKILSTYTKIYYRPDKAIKIMQDYSRNSAIGKKAKEDAKDWIEQLERWQARKFKGRVHTDADLNKFIKTYLDPIKDQSLGDGSEDITLLVSSGVLYRYLNTHPKSKVAPKILLWLAKIDRQFNQSYFFSLADVYLKQCIMNYPKTDYARECFNEYKDAIEFGFTGSSGVHIPKEEREMLNKLRSYLKN